jgi:TolA-binding protein
MGKEEAMSTDVRTQAGQAQPEGCEEASLGVGMRQEPQAVIQESIKYRRRAQDAERRVQAMEAELTELRQTEGQRAAGLEAELGQARAEVETLRGRMETLERDRQLERELATAGCGDMEAGLAVARARLASGAAGDDLAELARTLVAEKPHLRGAATGPVVPPTAPGRLPPPSAGPKSDLAGGVRRATERLADRARESGSSSDVLAYMRSRRGRAV